MLGELRSTAACWLGSLWLYQHRAPQIKQHDNRCTVAAIAAASQNYTAPKTRRPAIEMLENTERSRTQYMAYSSHIFPAEDFCTWITGTVTVCTHTGVSFLSSAVSCRGMTQRWVLLATPFWSFELTSNSLRATSFHHHQPSVCWHRLSDRPGTTRAQYLLQVLQNQVFDHENEMLLYPKSVVELYASNHFFPQKMHVSKPMKHSIKVLSITLISLIPEEKTLLVLKKKGAGEMVLFRSYRSQEGKLLMRSKLT